MGSEDYIRVLGEILETLPNTMFKVKIIDEKYPKKDDGTQHMVLAGISGKMRMGNIRVLPGDIVDVEISIYDTSRGRIVYRHKYNPQPKKF